MFDCIHICVFVFLKNCFEKLARHLLNTSSIVSYLSSFLSFFLSQSRQHLDTLWIDRESFWPFNSFSTRGGSIEPHLLLLVFLFLDSFSTHDLSTLFFSTPTRQMSRHHLDTSSIEIYWWSIYSLHAICSSFVSISLLIPLSFHLPNLSHSLQTSSLGIPKLFQVSLHLVSFYSLALHAFMFLKPKFWNFFKNLGFFKIDEILLKFWVSFWRFDLKNFMHCITFSL